MDELGWFCQRCGSCCRNVGYMVMSAIDKRAELEVSGKSVPGMIIEVAEFDRDINPDGSCSKLGPDGLCLIYDTRPDVCRVNRMWEKYWSSILTRKDWEKDMLEACKLHKESIWK